MEYRRLFSFRSTEAVSRPVRRSGASSEALRFSLPLLTTLTLAMCGGIAHADIYRYVNAEGVTRVTNTRPSGRHEVVVKGWPGLAAEAGPVSDSRGRLVRGFTSEKRSLYARQIQTAARAANVDPALIHAVISAESAYNPSARSPAGAVGLMQLMPETAVRYSVTDRLDPEQNIQGGTRYLGDLLVMFDNDLRLALAAYNAGENAVVRFGNRVPPYRETLDYVPRVMTYYRMYRPAS
jgi:soluble lytic murein transglycosylase-like protein